MDSTFLCPVGSLDLPLQMQAQLQSQVCILSLSLKFCGAKPIRDHFL